MKVVHHEFYTCRDGRVKEIKLIEIAPLCWEAWSKFEGEDWKCDEPKHKLTAAQIKEIR